MATTNTYNFDPRLWDIIEDAYERIQIEAHELNAQHVRSALRSLNLKLNAMVGYLEPQVQIENAYLTATQTQGQEFFTMPTGTFDILTMQVRRDGIDTEVTRIPREDYRNQSDKTATGRPSMYYLERRQTSIRVYPYLKPEAGDVFVIDYLKRPQDAGDMGNTLELPPHWHEAVTATLTAALAEKRRPEQFAMKDQLAKRARTRAKLSERSGGDMRVRLR